MLGRESLHGTRPPRFDAPIALDGHLAALPPGGTVKGMFIQDALACARERRPDVDVFQAAGVERRRVLAFLDYPYVDHMRIIHTVARLCWPSLPVGEGLRRIGQRAYQALLAERIGRVLFAAIGGDFGRVLEVGVKGWKHGVGFGEVRYTSHGPGHASYRFVDLPAFIETYQVGVVEGAMTVVGVEGEVWARLDGLTRGTLEVWWDT